MNGEILELRNWIDARLRGIEERQNNRHEANLKTFGNLPCDTHNERMKGLNARFGWICGYLGTLTAIVVWILRS